MRAASKSGGRGSLVWSIGLAALALAGAALLYVILIGARGRLEPDGVAAAFRLLD